MISLRRREQVYEQAYFYLVSMNSYRLLSRVYQLSVYGDCKGSPPSSSFSSPYTMTSLRHREQLFEQAFFYRQRELLAFVVFVPTAKALTPPHPPGVQ